MPPHACLHASRSAHAHPALPAGYNVLSASDAVGMGLNLAIRRVVFTSLRKFDGTQERQLTTAEIKQVGLLGPAAALCGFVAGPAGMPCSPPPAPSCPLRWQQQFS